MFTLSRKEAQTRNRRKVKTENILDSNKRKNSQNINSHLHKWCFNYILKGQMRKAKPTFSIFSLLRNFWYCKFISHSDLKLDYIIVMIMRLSILFLSCAFFIPWNMEEMWRHNGKVTLTVLNNLRSVTSECISFREKSQEIHFLCIGTWTSERQKGNLSPHPLTIIFITN